MTGKEEVRDAQTLFDCFNEIDKYKCKICPNFQTNLLARLKSHIRNGHVDENVDEYVYKCLKCLFVTNSKYLMGRHSLFSNCATNDEDERRKRFLCYQTATNTNFRLNNEPETSAACEINQFQCKQSTSKCTRKRYLKQRIKCCHSKPEAIRWFRCKQCSYKCKVKGYLKRHFQSRHARPEDINWHQCEQCSYKSKRKQYLNAHFRYRHANPEDYRYQCEQCPSKFRERRHLLTHIKQIHGKPKDIRWFHCEQCSYKCKVKSDVKKHFLARHANPEDINWQQCEQCSSKFKQRGYLVKHIQRIHGKH